MKKSINNAIIALHEKYGNAIPVFGGAYHGYQYAQTDFAKFVGYLNGAIENARFYHWHEDSVATARRFCHLCGVDPALVEAYLGMRFEKYITLI